MKTRKVDLQDWLTISKSLDVPVEELKECCPSLAVIQCSNGVKVVREGEPGVDVFIVGKGAMAVTHTTFLFFTKEVGRLKAGDVFGEVGFFVNQGRTATVSSAGVSEIYRILASDMQALIDRHADLRLKLEELGRERLQATSRAVSS